MQLLLIYIHKRKQQGDADTLDNHQSDWFQAWAKLKDYRSSLRYDHETNRFGSNFCLLLSSSFISLAPGTGLYGPGRAPDSSASSSPTVPGRQLRLSLEVRAVRELGRLHTEVNMSVHYLPEKPWIVIPPSGCLFSHTWLHVGGHEADWDELVTATKSCPGNIRADVGLKHHQDVRITDPFKPRGWAVLSLQEYQVRMNCGNSLQGSLKWQRLEDSKILQCFIREFIHFSLREVNNARLHLGPKASSHRN